MTLPQTFDPFHQWLAIPPAEQPPTLYRLLGLSPFEANANVIHAAADRQMAQLRNYATGKYGPQAEELLNRIAVARLTLTGEHKANYDAILRAAAPAARSEEAGDAAPPVASSPAVKTVLAVGKPLGAFDLLEQLKTSPLGNVYKACHRESQRLVSLKVLPPQVANNREVQLRFQREQQICLQLRHPNLIAGLAAGTDGGLPWLALEYVVGMDLGSLVHQQGPLPLTQAIDYLTQAAKGLLELHTRGVFHRNVKPASLLVDVEHSLRITNLFLARLGDFAEVGGEQVDLTITGQALGTAEYLPPEQAADAKQADQRSDIYSLGCTLHYLLTGRPPFGGKSAMQKMLAHRTTPIPSLRQSRADVSEELDATFQKMLAKDPAGRFTSMVALLDALQPKPKPTFWQRLFGSKRR